MLFTHALPCSTFNVKLSPTAGHAESIQPSIRQYSASRKPVLLDLTYNSWLQLCVALVGWDDCTPPSHLQLPAAFSNGRALIVVSCHGMQACSSRVLWVLPIHQSTVGKRGHGWSPLQSALGIASHERGAIHDLFFPLRSNGICLHVMHGVEFTGKPEVKSSAWGPCNGHTSERMNSGSMRSRAAQKAISSVMTPCFA